MIFILQAQRVEVQVKMLIIRQAQDEHDKDEKEAMLNILDTLVANSSRADNGTFKSESYKYIEFELEKLLPSCG